MQRLENIMTCLKAIVQMEALLDREIDRLEEEFDWDAKRCIYLQALECEAFHLDRLQYKMNKSQDLIQVYRRLLRVAVEEKAALISFLQNQKPCCKNESQKSHSERGELGDSLFQTQLNSDQNIHCCPHQIISLTSTASSPAAFSETSPSSVTIAAPARAGTKSVCCDITFLCQNGRLSKMRLKSRFEMMKFRRKISKFLHLKLRPRKTESFSVRAFKFLGKRNFQIA